MKLKTIFRRRIIFTPVIIVVAADLGSGIVYATAPILPNMFTPTLKQQIPLTLISINLHAFMGYLPQQMIKILLGARGLAQ
jgi:hypothetical protein